MPPASRPWASEDDHELRRLLQTSLGPDAIATGLDRDVGEVIERIARLMGQFGSEPKQAR